ncbi:MAG: TVP38/TMEM64 family protein [Betaproteobacteria bacterium]
MAIEPKATGGSKWIKLLIVAVFAGAIVAFFALGGQKYLTLETIKSNRDALLTFTGEHRFLMVLIAFGVYALAVACSLPGALLLSLTCGFLFGRWLGTAVIVCAATVGATIVFLAARYLIADWARSKMGNVGQKINEGFSENAFNYMLFLRLVPAFPFFLVNLAPAFTNIKLSTYVIATAIGIIPGTFVFANLGETLGTIDSLSGLVSKETLIAFALLGVLALVPVVIKKLKSRRTRAA